MTTRGFGVEEAVAVAHMIADVLEAPNDPDVLADVRQRVKNLTSKFPVYNH